LKHLVGFDHVASDGSDTVGPSRQILKLVPQGKQMLSITADLPSQSRCGSPLRDAAQDQHPLTRGSARPLKLRSRIGIEHATTMPAAVVQHRLPMSRLHAHTIGAMTSWTSQTVGMKQIQQKPVTRLRIQKIDNREIHCPYSWPHPLRALQYNVTYCSWKRPLHPNGPMSQDVFDPDNRDSTATGNLRAIG